MTTITKQLAEALRDAVRSLETIGRLAGKPYYGRDEQGEPIPTYMGHNDEVRSYANNRAGVALAVLAAYASRQAEPKTCIYPSCQHNGCLPDCEEQAEPSSGSNAAAPVVTPSDARVEAYTSERHFALREAHCIKAGDDYYAARPHLNGKGPRRETFDAGFERGFDKATELAEARAVLQAADAVSAGAGWQPIETAPKDGALFMCWVAAVQYGTNDEGQQYQIDVSQVDFCQWQSFEEAPDGGWFEPCCGHISDHQRVTHWMPLPAAPGSEKEAGNG